MDIRQKILTAEDRGEKVLEIPEWDVDVLILGLTAEQRVALGEGDANLIYLDVLVNCVHDPDTRKPLFTEADKSALAAKGSLVTNRIVNAALELSGLGEKSLKEAEKNSEAGQ